MTNKPLSDREHKLVEAVRKYFAYNTIGITRPATVIQEDLLPILDALRAYSPPKTYIMPAFNDIDGALRVKLWDAFCGGPNHSVGEFWNLMREATAKPSED